MPRFVILSGLSVASIAAAVWLIIVLRPPGAVTEANLNKIEIGMSESDVEVILGGPAGVYIDSPPIGVTASPYRDGDPKEWWGHDGIAIVQFSMDRKVIAKTFWHYPVRGASPTILDRSRKAFGR